MATSALEFEISPFRDVDIKALLLHNVTTDLILSLQASAAFRDYIYYVKDNLSLTPGFVTLNFHLFSASLERWNIPPTLVMTPVNAKGYDMNPSKDRVELAIRSYGEDILAMNALGGGAFLYY